MKLSVLIPSIPSRFDRMITLYNEIQSQCTGREVEILCFVDNKKRSIGYKRDALTQLAQGDYLTFIDDDDWVEPIYIEEIMQAINTGADVLCPKISCIVNQGNEFIVNYSIHNQNEEARIIKGVWVDVTRKPLHNCIWKSSIAKSEHFPDASYGEDGHWAKRLHGKVKSEHIINSIISHYTYDKAITEAALIFPKD